MNPSTVRSVQHLIPNGDGWQLSLYQTWSEERVDPGHRPVLIIPGYGMNSFIFSYHPNGISLEGYLAEAGFEVWRVDLRGQGESVRVGGSYNFSIEDLALTDVALTIDTILRLTNTRTEAVDVVGGSLGGSLMFAYAVIVGAAKLGTLVCIGTPVRWVKINPLIRIAFASPFLVGLVHFRGARQLARFGLPLLARRFRWLLGVYINPEITDLSAASEMARTVEDPNRFINRQIARWMKAPDLVVRGINIAHGLGALTNPLLCVYANGDGIVPPLTASFPYEQIGSSARKLLEVGTDTLSLAHADMFVSREAHERVFRPVRDWLLEQQIPRPPGAAKELLR
jgi:pimeloyl-ACP methyl ester carboxylesterase